MYNNNQIEVEIMQYEEIEEVQPLTMHRRMYLMKDRYYSYDHSMFSKPTGKSLSEVACIDPSFQDKVRTMWQEIQAGTFDD